MADLTSLFKAVLNLALTALPVMAAVILMRWVLVCCKTPRKYVTPLWALAAFRLCCPVTVSSALSLFNVLRHAADAAAGASAAVGFSAAGSAQTSPALNPVQPYSVAGNAGLADAARAVPTAAPVRIAAVIWCAGLAAMLLYGVVSCLLLRRGLSQATRRDGNVYECAGLPTPFVLGWIHPKIYLPYRLGEEDRTYVLLHEKAHLRRGDPWWKLAGFLILAVYWWDPAAWLCWFLFGRDMEMACDEAVLRRLGAEAKRGYSMSLVRFAAAGRLSAAAPLAFGECGAKSRVKNILAWKQARAGAGFLAVSLAAALAVSCCTNAEGSSLKYGGGTLSASSCGTANYSCQTGSETQYVHFYEDVYRDGRLFSSQRRLSLHCAGENRNSAVSLTLNPSPDLNWTLNGGGAEAEWTTASAGVSSSSRAVINLEVRKAAITGEDDLVLAAVYQERADGRKVLSTAPCESVLRDLDKIVSENDEVVLIRMAVSQSEAGGSPRAPLARTLCGLCNPYAGDAAADGAILDALNLRGELGNYTTELFTASAPYALQIDLAAQPDGAESNGAMFRDSVLLLTLIGNLSEVRWTWGTDASYSLDLGQAGSSVYALANPAPAGEADRSAPPDFALRDYAASVEDLSKLLDLLDAYAADQSSSALIPETPSGNVSYPSSGGKVSQFTLALSKDVHTVGVEAVAYYQGQRVFDRQVYTADAADFPASGRFWLSACPDRGSGRWGRAFDFSLVPWTDGTAAPDSPLADFTVDLSSVIPKDASFGDRAAVGFGDSTPGAVYPLQSGAGPVLTALYFGQYDSALGTGGSVSALSAESLASADALSGAVKRNDVVVLVELRLS